MADWGVLEGKSKLASTLSLTATATVGVAELYVSQRKEVFFFQFWLGLTKSQSWTNKRRRFNLIRAAVN
jgi:hypothetical protein